MSDAAVDRKERFHYFVTLLLFSPSCPEKVINSFLRKYFFFFLLLLYVFSLLRHGLIFFFFPVTSMVEITSFLFASLPEDDHGWFLSGFCHTSSWIKGLDPSILPHIGKFLLTPSTYYKGKRSRVGIRAAKEIFPEFRERELEGHIPVLWFVLLLPSLLPKLLPPGPHVAHNVSHWINHRDGNSARRRSR